jgi:hypothetical protein
METKIEDHPKMDMKINDLFLRGISPEPGAGGLCPL